MTDRNEPLEIIDAMDLDDVESAHDIGEWDSLQWQSLRTALEAQLRRFNAENAALRDELAQAKMQLAESETFNQTMVCGICGGSRNFAATLKAEAIRSILPQRESPKHYKTLDGQSQARGWNKCLDAIERKAKAQGDE